MSSNAPQSPPEAPLLQLLRPRQPEAASSPPNLYLLLSRAASTAQRRGGTSILVRETAARELEERRANWGYSKPVVALDIMWNLGFVIVTIVMLFCTIQEEPNVPIRFWVCGYALQCLVHILLVWIEFRRRNSRQERSGVDDGSTDEEILIESEEENEDRVGHLGRANNTRLKRCESLNTMASFVWWIVGIYWITLGGDALLQGAPRLYWLTVVFLAFDVIFALLCVVLACFLGIALCCCLPCIIAILYAIAGQEGATDADLSTLPKYGFQACKDEGRKEIVAGKMIPLETTSGYTTNERVLLPEDAECSICLNTYEDGTELTALPCNHHYHSACIVKWLKMNATCPLCKFNILKGNTQV